LKIPSFDGAQIHVTMMGDGRPLLLIHGFISNAKVNWIDYGTAKFLADAGFKLIMPDLRGHGASDYDCAYPTDVLRDDMLAVLHHFGVTDYDLVGYSLGARTAARLAMTNFAPAKLVLGGMGLSGMTGVMARRDWFIHAIEHRDAPQDAAAARVASFIKSMNMNPDAAIAVLKSQAVTTLADLRQLHMETLILSGSDDHDNGSAADLASALPYARYVEIPGNHMSCITKPDFGWAIRRFLTGTDFITV
jgi:pimeloyl-ACP methyl ester carboxylesterase